MVASTCRGTIDSRLLKIRRLAIGSSSKWPHVGFKMGYTALSSPLLSISILNHHQTGDPIGITGCEQTYGRSFAINRASRNTLVGGRGSDRIRPSSRIRSSTWVAPSSHMLWPKTGKKSIPKLFTRTVKIFICML